MGIPKFGNKEPVASHLMMLAKVWDISKGDVLELGTGFFSTLLLHWFATTYQRHVYSYESKKYWYERNKKYNNEFHHVIFCENWSKLDFDKKKWGMVFIDHSPDADRHKDILRLTKQAEYIVIHDTQPESDNIYHYSRIWKKFKYKYHYKTIKPWTSVVSNFHKFK